MTNEEAIKVLEIAKAEVEWDYPLDYAIAFDMAIEALQKQKQSEFKESINKANEHISKANAGIEEANEHIKNASKDLDNLNAILDKLKGIKK